MLLLYFTNFSSYTVDGVLNDIHRHELRQKRFIKLKCNWKLFKQK